MASLKHRETQQEVHGVEHEYFLANVSDPHLWERTDEESLAVVEPEEVAPKRGKRAAEATDA